MGAARSRGSPRYRRCLPRLGGCTVRPIGGACLGTSNADGVVGANGEVFDHPGPYVADASALPRSPGGAPSLTIAAWSANIADRLIAKLEYRGAPGEDQRTVPQAT
ncbi:GMC oxidoreductase [Ralstonia pseudosolanacearum]